MKTRRFISKKAKGRERGAATIKKFWKLIASVAACESAGIIGSVFTAAAVNGWYLTLQKPYFNPPSFIFAPVWTALYALMGISFFIIWSRGLRKKEAKLAAVAFGIQLALNVLWSMLFFGLKSPAAGFICITALWIAILVTIIKFYRISKTAAYLLIPYILWVSFAAALNYGILILN